MIKPMPKSLHTVTALVRVARYVLKHSMCAPANSAEAVEEAARLLGYNLLAQDIYKLGEQAAALLAKEA